MPPALYLSILPTLTFCLPDNNPLQIRKKMGESSHSLTLTLHSLQSQDDYNNGSNPDVLSSAPPVLALYIQKQSASCTFCSSPQKNEPVSLLFLLFLLHSLKTRSVSFPEIRYNPPDSPLPSEKTLLLSFYYLQYSPSLYPSGPFQFAYTSFSPFFC